MISVTTYIFAMAFTTVFTGTFLAIGFILGRFLIDKLKTWWHTRRGLKSKTVKDFIYDHQQILSLQN